MTMKQSWQKTPVMLAKRTNMLNNNTRRRAKAAAQNNAKKLEKLKSYVYPKQIHPRLF